jgi:hypothetical protein
VIDDAVGSAAQRVPLSAIAPGWACRDLDGIGHSGEGPAPAVTVQAVQDNDALSLRASAPGIASSRRPSAQTGRDRPSRPSSVVGNR